MLRWVGALLIIACGTALGALRAEHHRRRPRQLMALRGAIQILLTEIDIGLTPLPEALARAAQAADDPIRRLFADAAARIKHQQGLTGGAAWQQALEATAPDLSLDADDTAILAALSSCLGRTDREDQRRHLELAAARLAAAEARAQDGWQDRYRLSLYLGALTASILAIALL